MRRNTLLPALLGWATVSGYDADPLSHFYPDICPIFSTALTIADLTELGQYLGLLGLNLDVTLEAADMEPEEVEPVRNMDDSGLFFVQAQAPLCNPAADQWQGLTQKISR